jgi:peptide/nickel transport system substrate-binding protein
MTKRAARLSRRALLALSASSGAAAALGRTPYGGTLRLSVPWPVASLDPASVDDAFSALFAGAVFEPLYALDSAGNPYPTLAEALPSEHEGGCRLQLRPGLKTGAGRTLTAVDVAATFSRARTRGGVGVLSELESPVVRAKDPLTVEFPRAAPDVVARALTSPLLAVVPRGFSPLSPEGCGAFRVELSRGRALFTRNPYAARGPAFLESIEVRPATDLAELLRGFEAGRTDVGWFGSGLYRAVKDAVSFEASPYGFAVLLAGKTAGAWGAPGTLQALLDAIPSGRLSHLGLRGLPERARGSASWGGPSTTIAVNGAAPQLVAVARALASAMSTPGHELTVDEKSLEELGGAKSSRQFGLLVDCVRAPSAAPRELEMALRSAASPEAARRTPRTASAPPRDLGRQLPLGVVGELSVWGARRAAFEGLDSWQLGAVSFRADR